MTAPVPPLPNLAEIREQHERAHQKHAAAIAGLTQATHAFDADGSDRSFAALSTAREIERQAGDYLARAQRVLDVAKQADGTARLAALESERRQLELEQRSDPVGDAIDDQLVAAATALADHLVARLQHNLARAARRTRLAALRAELGEPLVLHHEPVTPSWAPIGERLRALTAGLPSSDARVQYLYALSTGQVPT
jgi:hypothetical protein